MTRRKVDETAALWAALRVATDGKPIVLDENQVETMRHELDAQYRYIFVRPSHRHSDDDLEREIPTWIIQAGYFPSS